IGYPAARDAAAECEEGSGDPVHRWRDGHRDVPRARLATPKREVSMARVAVVTGGTRGIGRAISVALKDAGYRVAAVYAGDDKAAQQFNKETGIPVFKFNVADVTACTEGVKAIE